MSQLLELIDVSGGYGEADVIRHLHLAVNAGEIVALLGANGAGKTTTIRTIAGEARRTSGRIVLDGEPLDGPLHRRARRGISFIFDDRTLISGLSAQANLQLAKVQVAEALRLFPELGPHLKKSVGLLSGGQQQMLSLAKCLGRRPKLLVIDELSLGLAPLVVDRLLTALVQAAQDGAGVLVVEQHVHKALNTADRCYAMRRGELIGEWAARDLRARPELLEEMYVGGGMDEPLAAIEAIQHVDTPAPVAAVAPDHRLENGSRPDPDIAGREVQQGGTAVDTSAE